MLPWKDIYAALGKIFTLTQETQKNKADIKGLGEKVDDLSKEVKSLNREIHELKMNLRPHPDTRDDYRQIIGFYSFFNHVSARYKMLW